jgi:cell division protein ZapA
MTAVNLMVNGQAYPVGCADGEEAHVRELGQFIDSRVRGIAASVGQVGDARLMLMAGLAVADELADALAKLRQRDAELAALKSAQASAAETQQNSEDIAAAALDGAASRLEAIAARLAHA